MKIGETAIETARLTISVLIFLMLAGTMSYLNIPKEAEPDIQIPIIYVITHADVDDGDLNIRFGLFWDVQIRHRSGQHQKDQH